MKAIERITVVGAGAMGSSYASMLYDMNSESVSFLAGGRRYERLSREGVTVNGRHFPVAVVHPDRASPADLVIVAVKHHHLPRAIQEMKNIVGEDTVLLSVMNGIDSEEELGAVYGKDKLLYAIALGIDAVREGNRTRYSRQGKILFGEARNNGLTDRVRAVAALFESAGITYEIPEDMFRALWWKFMINVGINQVSAVLRAPYGVFQESEDAMALMEEAMREVIAIAEAVGVGLTEQEIGDWKRVLMGLATDGKTSMLQDVEAGRKTEVEMLGGRVTALGARYGVPTPVNRTLYRILKVIEGSLPEAKKE